MRNAENTTHSEAEFMASLLRQRGIRVTRQRLWIATTLFARPQHLSVEQLFDAVRRQTRTVSRATVYNTLNLFLDRGLVRRVVIPPDKVFYDSNTSAHHHIYNRDTDVLSDLPAEAIRISEMPRLPDSTVSTGVDIIVHVRNSVDDVR